MESVSRPAGRPAAPLHQRPGLRKRLRKNWRRCRRRLAALLLTDNPRPLFMAGTALLSVPTAYTVFPELSDNAPVLGRVVVVVLWLLAATLVGVNAGRQSRQIRDLVGDPLRVREDQRVIAGAALLTALLEPELGPLAPCQFRVFSYDSDEERLVTSWCPEGVFPYYRGFAPGRGAVGVAFEEERYVVAQGCQCSDGTYGLDEEQQKRYSKLQTVAAMPLWNARKDIVAVLVASSTESVPYLSSEMGKHEMARLAAAVGRVWIDIYRAAGD